MIMAVSAFNAYRTTSASLHLHNLIVLRLLHAPTSWWEKTPSGRVLSRFSGDLNMMDRMVSRWCVGGWMGGWVAGGGHVSCQSECACASAIVA